MLLLPPGAEEAVVAAAQPMPVAVAIPAVAGCAQEVAVAHVTLAAAAVDVNSAADPQAGPPYPDQPRNQVSVAIVRLPSAIPPTVQLIAELRSTTTKTRRSVRIDSV
jgi:hypothetical protein